jgi:hypothetical protein
MAAYYKVDVVLNSQAVSVGLPSPQSVRVTLPLVGPQGPAGPQGEQGPPGEVSGSLAWDNVTDKPSTFPPEAHAASHYQDGPDALEVSNLQSVLGNNNLGEDINTIDSILNGLGTAATSDAGDFAEAVHAHVAADITDFTTAAAAAAPVASVAGRTGAVTLAVTDVANAVSDTDARLSDSRTPTSHAASHFSAGADPIAPSDIGAQSIFVTEDLGTITANVQLTAARAKIYTVTVNTFDTPTPSVQLPSTGVQAGDIVEIRFTSFTGREMPVLNGGSGFLGDSLKTKQKATYIAASTSNNSWTEQTIARHAHGNITNEGAIGTTSGLPIKTGASGVLVAGAFGTGAGDFCEGNDSRFADIPDPSAATPQALGTAAAGTSDDYSRGDHVHPVAGLPIEFVIACSDETSDLATGTAKVTFRAPVAFLLTAVASSVNTAPTGSTLIVDINNGANSTLSTKLSIDADEKTSATAASAAVIDTDYDDIAADAEITIDIDQIGSTVAGKGLKVILKGTRA